MVALAALAVLNVAWSMATWRWSVSPLVDAVPYQLLAWSAVGLSWLAVARRRSGSSIPIAITLTLWTVGDLIWSVADQIGAEPGPGVADALYLLGYPVLALGIWCLVRRVTAGEARTAALLDGVLVAVTGGVLLWNGLGQPTYQNGASSFARLVDASYPMLDVLLVACCVWLVSTPARSRQLVALTAMVGVSFAADVLFATANLRGSSGIEHLANALYPIAYLCGAAACWCEATTEVRAAARMQRGRVVLLGMAFAALPLTVVLWVNASAWAAMLAVVAASLAFARLAGAAVSADRRHRELDVAMRTLERTRAALLREATVDALTGLANRRALVDHLAAACERGTPSVVFCDLDRFKPINDGFGHHIGDRLLAGVATRLSRLDADLVARLGGDEFVLVIDDGEHVRTHVAAAGTLACISTPIDVDGHHIDLAGSVGVATAAFVGEDPTVLLRNADLAMYSVKSSGGRRVSAFEQALSTEVENRARVETALRETVAGRAGRFALAWQPIVGRNGEVIGKEALLRWWHGDRWHLPGEFISIADDAGLLRPISRIVLEQACQMLAQQAAADDPTIVGVNISGGQLVRPDFVQGVAALLDRYGIDPAQLCIEVTEDSLAGSSEVASQRLVALAALGVRLAIDDFGVGATSIAHLRQLPFHYVKLDRAFVVSVESDPLERRLLADLVQLIHGIGRVVVIEGIETESEERAALNAGADLFQGFRFGRPALEEREQPALKRS